MTMRVAIVNPVWDQSIDGAGETLCRFRTLTGWADAIAAAGAAVTVHQRFPSSASLDRGGISYQFVQDAGDPEPRTGRGTVSAIAKSVVAATPDLVHVNGVTFPAWLRALRRELPRGIRMVVQDHGGWDPTGASRWARLKVRRGLMRTDAVLVSSPGQAGEWRGAGVVPKRVPVADVMEASTEMTSMTRREAVERSGVTGDPAILSVGRLMPNKDPLTILEGFARFAALRPGAKLSMVFNSGTMHERVHEFVERDPRLAGRVRLVGPVPLAEIAAFYSAADIYVSASHREGSGYAAIEAMACGATPVLTDIPPFRVMTSDGTVGELWPKGHAQRLCDALAMAVSRPGESMRARVRAQFESTLSWHAIGRRAVGIYRDVCDR